MMPAAEPAAVAFHDCRPAGAPQGHDALTRRELARLLAEVLQVEYLDEVPPETRAARRALVVPSDTLPTLAAARRLGIHAAARVFGGVVPQPFVATKVIGHALASARAVAPTGWSRRFAAAVSEVVLPGCSTFDAHDAIAAGERLLRDGPVRLKEAAGIGGAGQHVVEDTAQLRDVVAALERDGLFPAGIVIERNLRDVTTFSVGQVRVAALTAGYVGTQRLVTNPRGHATYGGSDLTLVRGDMASLLDRDLSAVQRGAVERALAYHRAALECFPGLIATRANYDVAYGRDAQGRALCGVLEQSWRIGGASGAEIAALHAFRADPTLRVVHASTREVYGEGRTIPSDAWVHYDGVDGHGQRLVKYVEVRCHGYV